MSESSMPPVSMPHIEITPDVCFGKPRVTGTRISVQDIVVWHDRLHISPDEIVAKYPQLTLASVHAALAYYFDHREEVDARMARGEELAEELRRHYPSKLPARAANS